MNLLAELISVEIISQIKCLLTDSRWASHSIKVLLPRHKQKIKISWKKYKKTNIHLTKYWESKHGWRQWSR